MLERLTSWVVTTMIKWILQDTKRVLKSRKVIFILAIVVISIVVTLVPQRLYGQIYYGETYILNGVRTQMSSSPNMSEDTITIHEELKSRFKRNCLEDDLNAVECTAEKEYMERYGQYDNDYSRPQLNDEERLKNYFSLAHTYLTTIQSQINKQNADYQALIVPKLLDYHLVDDYIASIEQNVEIEAFDYELESDLFNAKKFSTIMSSLSHNIYIAKHDIPQYYNISKTSGFFLAGYFNTVFVLLIFLAAIIIFDSIFKDYKSGVIKTIMSTPTRRIRYFILKAASAFLSIIIVIVVPLLIVTTVLYMIDKTTSLAYPIHISKTTLNSFSPYKAYASVINEFNPPSHFSTYQNICNFGPVTQYPMDLAKRSFGMSVPCNPDFSGFHLISIGKYLGMITLHLTLVFALLVSINNVLSLYVKSSLLNMVMLTGILGVSLVLIDLFMGQAFLKFLPFTFINPVQLLMGTIPYTYLNGLVTLGSWLIGLNVFTMYRLKRHDFTH